MNFLAKKRNILKESKKTEKISQKEQSKSNKISKEIEQEEEEVQQQNEVSKKSLKQSKKVQQQQEEIEVEVEQVEEQNETQKKLSKKEKKELKKQKKLKEQQNEEIQDEEEEVEAKSEKEKSSKKQHQNGQKDNKKESIEIEEEKQSKKKDQQKKEKLEEKQEAIKKVEPKIVKKPKITIIEDDDDEDSEGEVEKKHKQNKESDSENFDEEEDDSDLEELRRVKKQMQGKDDEDSDDDNKKFDDDSDDENFKDLSSDEEDLKNKKKQTVKADTKQKESKNQPKKIQQDAKGKIKNLNEKIKLKHLAICIPDSIISIPQSSELRSYFISELARTAAINCVDEIIILKDNSYIAKSQNFQQGPYIARNLQYLETPQYLRKQLFPIHPDLKNAGLMNPIECHHHLKSDQYCPYREGVVMNRPTKENDGSWVEIGLKKQAMIPYKLAANTRVTLRVNEPTLEIEQKNYTAEIVSQKEPKEKLGLYWGYQVRLAESLSQVLKGENEVKYDIKFLINQGDHQQFSEESINDTQIDFSNKRQRLKCILINSVLIVFSGYNNLESIIDSDEQTKLSGKDALNKFDGNFTMQKGQYGVKQLRLEEEMSQGLSILRRMFN